MITFDDTYDPVELDRLVDNSPRTDMLQLGAWAKVKDDLWYSQRFAILDDGKLIGAAQMLFRRLGKLPFTIAYSARAPIFTVAVPPPDIYGQVVAEMERRARQHHALVFHFDPPVLRDEGKGLLASLVADGYEHMGFDYDMREIQPRNVMMVELDGSVADYEEHGVSKAQRQRMRRAAREPFVIEEKTSDDLDDFVAVIDEMADRQQITMRSKHYFAKMYDSFAGDRNRLTELGGGARPRINITVLYLDRDEAVHRYRTTIANLDKNIAKAQAAMERATSPKKKAGQERNKADLERSRERQVSEMTAIAALDRPLHPLASALLVFAGRRVFYLYGGSTDDFRQLLPTYGLLKNRMEYCRDYYGDVPFLFDFGGVSGQTDTDKDPKYGGLYKFKQHWGCTMVEYLGEFRKPIMPVVGHLFVHATEIYKKVRHH